MILLHMYTGTEQLSKLLVDCGIQVSQCWSGKLQICKGKRLEHVVMNQSWRHQCELMFTLKRLEMATYRYIYRYVYIHVTIHIYFLVLFAERIYKQQHPAAVNTPSTQISEFNFLLLKKSVLFGEMIYSTSEARNTQNEP